MKQASTLFLSLLFSLLLFSQTASATFLVVDTTRAYKEYWKAQVGEKELEAAREKAKNKLEGMVEEGEKIVKEIRGMEEEYDSPAISKKRKLEIEGVLRKKIELVRGKENDIAQYQKEARQDLEERKQKLIEVMAEEIHTIIKQVAKEEKADLVLNSSNLSLVVYAQDKIDITAKVIGKLNANKP